MMRLHIRSIERSRPSHNSLLVLDCVYGTPTQNRLPVKLHLKISTV